MSSSGPPQALSELFEEAAALVHRTARRITGSAADAEDVLQTVFLHLLETSPPAPWPDNPRAYVHRSAVNASLDVLRRRKRKPESPLEFDALPAGERDEEDSRIAAIGSRRETDRLRDALHLLSPLEAEMFSLRYLEEKDNGEIAELLDKTPNHVRVTLHAARRKLRTELDASTAAAEAEAAARVEPEAKAEIEAADPSANGEEKP